MDLQTFKTLWGVPETGTSDGLARACRDAVVAGFDGIEGQVPFEIPLRETFGEHLAHHDLRFIAEVCTAGSYVPDRTATLEQHLQDLERQLDFLKPLHPQLVNCLGGCDRWDLDISLAFFEGALELADRAGLAISFETHRGRPLYSPWVAEKILERMAIPLTCDFSHWCVVCEGLSETEDSLIREVAEYAVHIHGRVGYDQGPQVSAPDSTLYSDDLAKHLAWWRWIWQAQQRRGFTTTTLTPEFGPDGYQMIDPRSGDAVGDLNEINAWMAERIRKEFGKTEDDGCARSVSPSPLNKHPQHSEDLI